MLWKSLILGAVWNLGCGARERKLTVGSTGMEMVFILIVSPGVSLIRYSTESFVNISFLFSP